MNVLFTSAGRRVELLRSFRQAFETLGITGRIVAVDTDPLAPALQIADAPYITPRVDAPDYLSVLVSICRRERVDLVFPLIDPDIPILARHRDTLEATGARVAAVSERASTITGDKWLTAQFFRGLDLPTPRSWLPGELPPEPPTFPLFIKPRRGSASKHSFKVCNTRELDFFSHYVPDPIIQEFVDGPEITCDIACDLDGEVLATVMRQRIEVRSGEVAKGVTIYDPVIHDACVRIAEALPAIGPITVQCMMNGKRACFTEINARFGGGVPLGTAAGVHAPALILARAIGKPDGAPRPGAYRVGLYMTRYDSAFFLVQEDRDALARRRL